jgi:hypothetical protein
MFRILDKDHPRLGISISEDIIAKMSEAQRRINRTGEKKKSTRNVRSYSFI